MTNSIIDLSSTDHKQNTENAIEETPRYCDLILPLGFSQFYTYQLSDEDLGQVTRGSRVLVQFSARKYYTGVVYRVHNTRPNIPQVKFVSAILDQRPLISEKQLQLWEFVADYYRTPLGLVYKNAVPSGLILQSETKVSFVDNPPDVPLTEKESIFLSGMEYGKAFTLSEVDRNTGSKNTIQLVHSLIDKGILDMQEYTTQGYKPKKRTFVKLSAEIQSEEDLHAVLLKNKRSQKQQHLLNVLYAMSYKSPLDFEEINASQISKAQLLKASELSAAVYASVEKKGYIVSYDLIVNRVEEVHQTLQAAKKLTLHQEQAYQAIEQAFESHPTVLLHGVTSSGKTELYVKLIQKTIEEGKQVLYLIPEIGLTTQLANRLKRIFGAQMAVYHSKYSDSERVEIWRDLLYGDEVKLVLGVRSSLFLPFTHLGLVIVDEEHDNSYRQLERMPHYQGRNMAVMLAHIHKAKTLLGTSTPSLESYTNVKMGKYGYAHLDKRYGDIPLPHIEVVDLRPFSVQHQMKGRFSPPLLERMQAVLDQGQQVILLQSKRGYASHIECKRCGWVPSCPNCDVTLTYHKAFNKLTCHYCNYTVPVAEKCEDCGSTELVFSGYGTEEIEQEIKALFPSYETVRLDRDTTKAKKAFEELLADFEAQRYQIMIGTQMISKGLDFAKVGLVGVINADQFLNSPDFQAGERAYQMLVQVSGRSGRSEKQGEVVIQTRHPDLPIFSQIKSGNFETFYRSEMEERQLFNYPPYCRLIQVVVKHRDPSVMSSCARTLGDNLRQIFGSTKVLGPNSPNVGRIQNMYIKYLIVKIEFNKPYNQAKIRIDEVAQTMMQEVKGLRIYLEIDFY